MEIRIVIKIGAVYRLMWVLNKNFRPGYPKAVNKIWPNGPTNIPIAGAKLQIATAFGLSDSVEAIAKIKFFKLKWYKY